MKRSLITHFFLPLIAALLFHIGGSQAVAAENRPNVIFILGDDQAWWDYSFMYRAGVEKTAIDLNPAVREVAQTPAIDRLADQGLTFTHGYVMPLCRPSLASMITGVFPHQHHITGNDLVGRPPDEAVERRMQVFQTLPRILSAKLGYTSFQTGKWWEGHPSNGGFSGGDTANSVSLSNPNTRPARWTGAKPSYVKARHGDWGLMIGRVDYVNQVANPPHPINYANTIVPATDFINAEVAAKRPFFLWYAPFLAHDPFDPPAGLLSKYDALVKENDEVNDPVAKYYANIERFDGGVGALLDHLDTKGIAENTIVVLICDNGYIKADTGTYAPKSKTSPYDGGVRSPIMVRWPARIKAGGALPPQFITKPVSIVDLVPTVLSALGLEKSAEMTGVDLLNLDAVNARDSVFGEDNALEIKNLPVPSESLESRYVVRNGWKLILLANGNTELYRLYDTTTRAPVDPFETNNLAAANPTLVAELTKKITTWYDEPNGHHGRD